jgi:hypothetical protein
MAKTYEPIATTTLSTATAEVTFSSISGSYTDLVYIIYNKSGGTNSRLRFNSDSGSNYSATQLYANGSSAASLPESNQTRAPSGTIDNNGMAIGHIMNYSNTTTYKTLIARGGAGTGTYLDAVVSLWRSTSAITSISFTQDSGSTNFASGSTFTLYGIASA